MVLTAATCWYWHETGCGWESLAAAVIYYNGACAALWYAVRAVIKERRAL